MSLPAFIEVWQVWCIAALLLASLELLLPGYFLLWIGLGAATTALVAGFTGALGIFGQAIVFLIASFLWCAFYAKTFRKHLMQTRRRSLYINQRGASMVGQKYQLYEAIESGRGKVAVGDGQWLCTGPDLPKGAWVKVTSVNGSQLHVQGEPPGAND